MKTNRYNYLGLHLFLMVYASGGIVVKLAALQRFLSPAFLLLYSIEVLILLFYALGWQQIVKRMPLSVAYANKAVTVFWGAVWGVLFFHERLSVGKVVGILLALGGIALYGYADGKVNRQDPDGGLPGEAAEHG